jgi:hypothetical protein
MSAWSRRAFLGGAAAVVTLPWLESLRGARADGAPPVRLLYWFLPNGIHMPAWTPATEGEGWALTPILSPLAAHQGELTVLSGLTNLGGFDPSRPGDHARGTAAFLTCEVPQFEGVHAGVSVDQIAAQARGGETPFPSLQLGVDGSSNAGVCDSGYACSYSNNISWAGPATPLPKQTDPQIVFDRLFAGFDAGLTEAQRERRARYRTSVLDLVKDDATRLGARVANADRHRLNEYLEGIRQLEQRLQSGALRACEAPARPAPGLDVQAHIDVMSELTAIALRCDLTRYVTFMLGNGGSNRNYSFIGASGAHHEVSHHQDLPENLDKLTTIGAWEMERFAVLLDHLRTIPEGDGTLLNHTLALVSSDISDGNRHNHDDMPVLLAGRGGGAVRPGRHLRADGAPIADLYLTMLQAAGVAAEGFGLDGTAPMGGLG